MKKTRSAFFLLFLVFLALPSWPSAYGAGGGDILFTPDDPNVNPVLFSHDLHLTQLGINCSSCHYEIFQMAKGSCKMKMEMITKGNFCGVCHNGQKAFDVKDKNNCKRCHNQKHSSHKRHRFPGPHPTFDWQSDF